MATDTFGVLSTAHPHHRRHRSFSAESAEKGDRGALEIALLRRSLAGLADAIERCGHCERTMLIGERVYEYPSGAIRCALCRERERQQPADSHTVHGPEFGHSIRVIDRRVTR